MGAGQPACLISAACTAYQVHVPVELQSPSEKTTLQGLQSNAHRANKSASS